ncbi:MAG: ABC transporter ATP-binding protein [Clostridia bacterium]|nr:ABC transporter ATP-binding protein [Clostridia bacterium]
MKKTGSITWIAKRIRPYIPGLVLLILMATCVSYIGVRFALVSRTLIDTATGQTDGNLVHSICFLVALLVVQLILRIVYIRVHVHISGKLAMDIRTDLYYQLMKKDYVGVSSFHSGEILSRLVSDVSMVCEKTTEIIPNVFALLSTVVFSFTALFTLDKYFALACLAFGPIVMLAAYIYKKKIKTLHLQCRESDGKVRSFLQETLQNFLVVKAFSKENLMREKSKELQYENFRLQVKRSTVGILSNVMFFVAVTAGYYAALAWSVYRLSLGLITFGTVTAVLGLVGQLQSPFRELASVLPQCYMVSASAQRLMKLEKIKDEKEKGAVCAETIEFEAICFEDIFFHYGDVPVLNGVNLTVKKGEFIALCGPSGGGKSTMTRLLLSVLEPEQGSVFIRTTAGEKIPFSSATRHLFSYVPQGNMILSGTICENIAFGDKQPDRSRVERAISLAQLTEAIEKLPKGMDTVLGEKGHGLSEGQIQRIAIARALYHDAPVLLLDEATSSLDIETEKNLLQHIRSMTDKTCIIVSHRKEVMDACDKTYYLQDGSLHEL